MKLAINRNRWIRGEGGRVSYLYRSSDKKMCCLGFYCLAIGIKIDQMRDIRSPYELARSSRRAAEIVPLWLSERFSEDTQALIEANDDEELPDAEKEILIKDIFAQHGVKVEFKG